METVKIAGLQKMTLLDFPGKVACTVFLQGCNFRCPFCHNSDLLGAPKAVGIEEQELLDFLKKRRGLLDGVCITGGEPTLQPELPQLLAAIKGMGYAVKLDTNGSNPDMLKNLVRGGLLDYVAMDIKNCEARYGDTVGVPKPALAKMRESMAFLMTGDLDYEFRTTVVDEFHDETAIREMGNWLKELVPGVAPKRLFLQPYADRDSVLMRGLHTPSREKIEVFAELLRPCTQHIEIRGID